VFVCREWILNDIDNRVGTASLTAELKETANELQKSVASTRSLAKSVERLQVSDAKLTAENKKLKESTKQTLKELKLSAEIRNAAAELPGIKTALDKAAQRNSYLESKLSEYSGDSEILKEKDSEITALNRRIELLRNEITDLLSEDSEMPQGVATDAATLLDGKRIAIRGGTADRFREQAAALIRQYAPGCNVHIGSGNIGNTTSGIYGCDAVILLLAGFSHAEYYPIADVCRNNGIPIIYQRGNISASATLNKLLGYFAERGNAER
jgi:hypothetical protein